MKICLVASEMTPFAKTGGLADMVQGLAHALARRGHEVRVLLPRYRTVAAQGLGAGEPVAQFTVDLGGRSMPGALYRGASDGVELLLVDQPEYFDRPALYGEHGGEYGDNPYRFAFLAHAALLLPELLGTEVDVYHCHDWQGALVPYLLRRGGGPLRAATVLTVHNLAYQGNFPPDVVEGCGLGWDAYTWRGIEFYGRVSLLKAGLLTADRLTTVSPRYAEEIQTPAFGCGLEGVLWDRRADLAGILNGADYDTWNPEVDPYLAAAYSPTDLTGKAACRAALAAAGGWDPPPAGPIFGMVTRLVYQKGADVVPGVLPAIAAADGALVVVGTGEPALEDALARLAAAQPDRAAVTVGFDERLAHQVIAGADALLVPSRFEPCGLTQMYALRYGTVPVVRRTGGLADTVRPWGAAAGTGFLFDGDDAAACSEAVGDAARAFADRAAWQALMRRGMAERFSWADTAAAYERVYLGAQVARDHPQPLPWQV